MLFIVAVPRFLVVFTKIMSVNEIGIAFYIMKNMYQTTYDAA